MKYVKYFLSLTAFTLCLNGIYADGLGVFGSLWEPSDGEDVAGVGIRGRGGDGILYFEARGTYFEDISEDGLLFDRELSVIPFDLGIGLQSSAEEPVQFYGGAGITYYFIDMDNADVDDEFGYYFQLGAELVIHEGFGIFAEGVWRHAEAKIDDDGDVDEADFDLEGSAVNLGIVFRW